MQDASHRIRSFLAQNVQCFLGAFSAMNQQGFAGRNRKPDLLPKRPLLHSLAGHVRAQIQPDLPQRDHFGQSQQRLQSAARTLIPVGCGQGMATRSGQAIRLLPDQGDQPFPVPGSNTRHQKTTHPEPAGYPEFPLEGAAGTETVKVNVGIEKVGGEVLHQRAIYHSRAGQGKGPKHFPNLPEVLTNARNNRYPRNEKGHAMILPEGIHISYVRKIFFFTHGAGLLAGIMLPIVGSWVIGPQALSGAFFLICLATGLGLGMTMFSFLRITLRAQMQTQLTLLEPLAGRINLDTHSFEAINTALKTSVEQVEKFVHSLLSAMDQIVPHYRALASTSAFLSDRAHEGLAAARAARLDVEAMDEKQKQISQQIGFLADRTQDESAISRELFASIEEMAQAMDHSNNKFLETTTCIDEMASTVRSVAKQAESISSSVESTLQDLERLGEVFERMRSGATTNAQSVNAVRHDAENGLKVVDTSIQEMGRIASESQKAIEAMERLSRQTGEAAKIIEVIKELVSDTELLAFNAAIIAAKAGAEGKGFSVVAEEIRELADRTSSSAQDIHRIVKAIGEDTREVTRAVQSTGTRILRGKELTQSTGDALRKIAESSVQAALASNEIASLTATQEQRAQSLLQEVDQSLRSVKGITRFMHEQQLAIKLAQEGSNHMKSASEQITHGMEDQVRANREFEKNLLERQTQLDAIVSAVAFQAQVSQKVFAHFQKSETRLIKNTERISTITKNISGIERLTEEMKNMAGLFAVKTHTDQDR